MNKKEQCAFYSALCLIISGVMWLCAFAALYGIFKGYDHQVWIIIIAVVLGFVFYGEHRRVRS